jgi:prefoldin beta subunit
MTKETKEEKEEKHGDEHKHEENDPNVLVAQFQLMQQQLQQILMQKESLGMAVMEIDRAVEELDKSKDGEAYNITGTIMVRKPVAELKKELAESKEDLQVRIKSMDAAEKRFTDRLVELQGKLKSLIK